MAVIHFASKNRLAWRAGFRGISKIEAVARAQENIEKLREDGVAEIDRELQVVQALFLAYRADPEANATVLYDASNAIGGVAAVFGYPALGTAAYSLCNLLCQFETGTPVNFSAVKAHLDSLVILRHHTALGDVEAAEILKNLSKLIGHLGAPPRAAGANAAPQT